MDTDKKPDVNRTLHESQIRRARNLITEVQNNQGSAVCWARFYWYLCHLFALLGCASGVSVGVSTLANYRFGGYLIAALSFASALYPLAKYLDLEGRRIRAEQLVLFCTRLADQISDAADVMQGILDHGFDPTQDTTKWDTMVNFISQTRMLMQQMRVGSERFQQQIEAFSATENSTQQVRRIIERAAEKSVIYKGDSPTGKNIPPVTVSATASTTDPKKDA